MKFLSSWPRTAQVQGCRKSIKRYVALSCMSSICVCLLQSIVGVAGGATRAALTVHQARRDNMADISAKDGSQVAATSYFHHTVYHQANQREQFYTVHCLHVFNLSNVPGWKLNVMVIRKGYILYTIFWCGTRKKHKKPFNGSFKFKPGKACLINNNSNISGPCYWSRYILLCTQCLSPETHSKKRVICSKSVKPS